MKKLPVSVEIRGLGNCIVQLDLPKDFETMCLWSRQEWLSATMDTIIHYSVQDDEFFNTPEEN